MSEEIKKAPSNLGASLNKSIGFEPDESSLKEESIEEVEETSTEEIVETEESQPTETNTDETTEEVVEAKEESTEQPTETSSKSYTQEEFDTLFNEKLEDAKLDWEDDYELSKPKEDKSSFLARMAELEKDGYKIDAPAFWKFQTEDINKTIQSAKTDMRVAFDMIADSYTINNPEVPYETVMDRLKLKYEPLINGDFDKDDREYRVADLDLQEEIAKSGKILSDFQKATALPRNEEIVSAKEKEALQAKIAEQKPKAERRFKRRVDKFLEQKESYSVQLGNEEIQYELSKEDKANIKEELTNLINTEAALVNENGLNEKPIEEGLLEKVTNSYIRNNENIFNSIVKKAADHLASIKTKEIASDLKNTKAPQETGSVKEKKILTDEEKIRQTIKAKKSRWR